MSDSHRNLPAPPPQRALTVSQGGGPVFVEVMADAVASAKASGVFSGVSRLHRLGPYDLYSEDFRQICDWAATFHATPECFIKYMDFISSDSLVIRDGHIHQVLFLDPRHFDRRSRSDDSNVNDIIRYVCDFDPFDESDPKDEIVFHCLECLNEVWFGLPFSFRFHPNASIKKLVIFGVDNGDVLDVGNVLTEDLSILECGFSIITGLAQQPELKTLYMRLIDADMIDISSCPMMRAACFEHCQITDLTIGSPNGLFQSLHLDSSNILRIELAEIIPELVIEFAYECGDTIVDVENGRYTKRIAKQTEPYSFRLSDLK